MVQLDTARSVGNFCSGTDFLCHALDLVDLPRDCSVVQPVFDHKFICQHKLTKSQISFREFALS